MKIVAVSDLHSNKDLYWKLWKKSGDILIIAGDLTHLGRELEMTSALDQIQTMNFKHNGQEVAHLYRWCDELPNFSKNCGII